MPGQHVRQHIFRQAKRIVVKVGTNAITDNTGRPDLKTIRGLLKQIAQLMDRGVNVTLVASGAVGAGLGELNINQRPKTLPKLQAAAAVGQSILMHHFHDILRKHNRAVAQILVNRDDFKDRTRILNIRQTMETLHDLHCLPVVNENDALATEELKYGDNDIIAASMTQLLKADVLILLTSVDGVLDGDGRVVDVIPRVDDYALSLADTKQRSKHGSGGMSSKMEAAKMATSTGELVIIANSRTPNVLLKLFDSKNIGTLFLPAEKKRSSRQRWIGLTEPVGKIMIDNGAKEALLQKGKSLLPSGIKSIIGSFMSNQTVSIVDENGEEIARGLVELSSEVINEVKGLNSTKIAKNKGITMTMAKRYIAVHRNNLTLIG